MTIKKSTSKNLKLKYWKQIYKWSMYYRYFCCSGKLLSNGTKKYHICQMHERLIRMLPLLYLEIVLIEFLC